MIATEPTGPAPVLFLSDEVVYKMNPKVDGYLSKEKKWQEEQKKLRKILLDCPQLNEEFKWRHPCYTFQGKNIVLIGSFKEYCALLFVKGALLKDAKRILVQPGIAQAGRQIRFTSLREIVEMESILKAYIKEAVEVEKSGLQVNLKKTAEYDVPEEFQTKLDKIPALKTAFNALTPGRQRGYLLYFSGAKQSKTRESRVEKCMPQILKGKGLDD
jgi:uncharacterized protein YdeI (YjbR/CyaY-like superfamily)